MYEQIKGTDMRPKIDCIFADIVMNSIDVMMKGGEKNLKQNSKPSA